MAEYYVRTKEGAKVQGPFTREQLKALAGGGKIKPHYLVSKDQRQWFVAENITDLPLGPAPSPGPAKAPRASKPARARPSASAAAGEPASFAEGAPEARVAARHVAGETAGAARRQRATTLILTGLGGAMFVLVGVVVYLLYFAGGDNGKGTDLDDLSGTGRRSAAAPGGGVSPNSASPPPGGHVSTPTGTGGTGANNSPPARRIDTPTPVPGPGRKFEPPRPARSFQVFSVTYGGEQVRAMGSRLMFQMTNESGKIVQSVTGAVRLYDPSGAFVAGLPMEIAGPIEAAATVRKGTICSSGPVLGMLGRSSKQMKFKFAVDKVTYDDGTDEQFK
jgi:hypothetical protein